MKKINIVVPCYNEEQCIAPFYEEIGKYLVHEGYSFNYLFVDDGSKDNTLNEVKRLREKDKKVNYLSFSRNFGKEAAMKAGLDHSLDYDAVIMIDADLQHPPVLINEMIEKYNEGYKIVYTKQRSRKNESAFKRSWARMFYTTFNNFSDIHLDQSTKDFMLIDKEVVKAFVNQPDRYRFTKGILAFVGFKRYALEFDYIEREKGKTKWSFKKLLKYGISGLSQYSTVFSLVPIIVSVVSFLVAIMSLVLFLTKLLSLDGFVILLSISLLFMLTNLSLWAIISVLYSTRRETIKRPIYLVEETSINEKTVDLL